MTESDDQDAALADELRAHHAVMIRDLGRLTSGLADAAARGEDVATATRELEHWVHEVLVPHADEEEVTTYRAAAELPEGAPLIAAMLEEHVLIKLTVRHVFEQDDPVAAGTYARALFDIFDSHQRKENDIILPLLVDSGAVVLTEVMAAASHDHGHGHGHHHDHDHGH